MKVMLTGATGFIGSWTIPTLTSAGHDVIALIRRPDQAATLAQLVTERGGDADRVSSVIGDLAQPGLGLTESVDPDVIVHLGASFAWNLDHDVARATNVEGSLDVVRLAARHNAHLVLIGGYMLTNRTHLGELGIDLAQPDDTDWAAVAAKTGVYEASKIESHARAVALAVELGVTWQAIHPATLSGHSVAGHLAAGQPLYDLIDTVKSGRMAAIPGSRDHWLPLVTVDHLATLITRAIEDPHAHGRELLALDDNSPSLGELINLIATTAGRRRVRAHVPVGVLRFALSVPGLRRAVPTSRESLGFIRTDRFDVTALKAFERSHGIDRPDIRKAIAASTRAWSPTSPNPMLIS
ncbi:nucleoside-diphosphate-sugar epimerase [Aeromicrobium panaciterrae]|uniref:Nucleoside-diphosphate-sugar epimerase n=1 Tax=Aeromicrobium panaciterrae TaxID=363861 RepID=A0ABU1UQB9_9ACTN|nr:SDR family oxidoreductase [Aeromicrobium panaciterrae]MDR7087372.1 nucleoside-diphosphate-sugar epimerase [Aeromicrobium panaciterrae]